MSMCGCNRFQVKPGCDRALIGLRLCDGSVVATTLTESKLFRCVRFSDGGLKVEKFDRTLDAVLKLSPTWHGTLVREIDAFKEKEFQIEEKGKEEE